LLRAPPCAISAAAIIDGWIRRFAAMLIDASATRYWQAFDIFTPLPPFAAARAARQRLLALARCSRATIFAAARRIDIFITPMPFSPPPIADYAAADTLPPRDTAMMRRCRLLFVITRRITLTPRAPARRRLRA